MISVVNSEYSSGRSHQTRGHRIVQMYYIQHK